MAFTLDLLGGSSYVWRRKHDVLHHTWPNVAGVDDDIDAGFLARLAPAQPRHAFHRFQKLYMWPLLRPARGQVGTSSTTSPRSPRVASAEGGSRACRRRDPPQLSSAASSRSLPGRSAFLSPVFYPDRTVAVVYLSSAAGAGAFTLSVVFQLAHLRFLEAITTPGRSVSWAVHQVETTVDFWRGVTGSSDGTWVG